MSQLVQLRKGQTLEDVADDGLSTEELAIANDEAGRLRRLLAGLPDRERATLVWHYGLNGVGTLSFAEIAGRLGVSKGTAFTLEQRGLGLLRRAYASLGYTTPGSVNGSGTAPLATDFQAPLEAAA